MSGDGYVNKLVDGNPFLIICVSTHHAVFFKCITIPFVSCTSGKLGEQGWKGGCSETL